MRQKTVRSTGSSPNTNDVVELERHQEMMYLNHDQKVNITAAALENIGNRVIMIHPTRYFENIATTNIIYLPNKRRRAKK
jgi:hypothetical protein